MQCQQEDRLSFRYSHIALLSHTVISLLCLIQSFRFCIRYGHFAFVSDTVILLLCPIQSFRSCARYSHFAFVSNTVISLLCPIQSFRFCVRYSHFAFVSNTVISLLCPIQSFRSCARYSHFALVPDTVNFALVLTSGGYLLTQTCFLTSNLLLHSVPPLRSRDLSARHTRGNDVIDCNTSEIAADKDIKKQYRHPGEARRGHEKGLKLTLEI